MIYCLILPFILLDVLNQPCIPDKFGEEFEEYNDINGRIC